MLLLANIIHVPNAETFIERIAAYFEKFRGRLYPLPQPVYGRAAEGKNEVNASYTKLLES